MCGEAEAVVQERERGVVHDERRELDDALRVKYLCWQIKKKNK